MSWPESNEKLKELRRKWEADQFGLGTAGVYAVEEAVKEASEHLTMHDDRRQEGETLNDYRSRELRRRQRNGHYQEAAGSYMDRKFGNKLCRICDRKARNDPCDNCYRMVRDAAEWTETGVETEVYPCTMCDEPQYATICGTCMDVMLSGE